MANEVPTLERKEAVQPTGSVPHYGKIMQQYSGAGNIMGTIGSRVAQESSQQLAQLWGTELGKNPHGNLFPAITDFDKQVEASYKAQSHAVLSLQAEKLISDSQVELAKAVRLTPELIKSTNDQVARGLASIAAQAPMGTKEQLQANFARQMISNNQQYQSNMISQQREDQRNNLLAGLDLNNKNAMNLAAKGDLAGGKALVDQSKKMAESGHGSRLITPLEAKRQADSVEQSYLNGKTINEGMKAYSEGKYPEWAKHFATNPDKLPLDKFYNAGNAVQNQINFIHGLNLQDDQLRAARMQNAIASDVKGITEGMWNDFESNVNPQIAEKVRHQYIQAIKAADKSQKDTVDLLTGFSDPNVLARSTPKNINAAFDKLVNTAMQTAEQKGVPLTKDQAEVQVANSAGGPVPAFQQSLRNKLSSANPQQIESAVQQIHQLESMEGGHALNGIGEEYKAAAAKYEALRSQIKDPTEAAREMNTAVFNQDPLVQKAIKEKWSNILTTATKGGLTHEKYALNLVGTKSDKFINAGSASMAASTILETFNTYFTLTGGDKETAKKLTQQFYKENFGETHVNGNKPVETLHPIEKTLGYKTEDVVPYIHQDMANQLNERFAPIKKAFDEGKAHEYWEVLPQEKQNLNRFYGFGETIKPLKVKRHMKVGGKEVTNEFPVVLQGNAFDSWDVAVNTDSGLRNLFQIAPYLGITTYQPDKNWIDTHYAKDHH